MKNELTAKAVSFAPQRVHADDLGGDVHVADRHPLPAERAARQVPRDPGQRDDEGEAEEVGGPGRRRRAGDGHAEDRALGCGDLARGRVVVEPRHLVEEPDEEELRGERGDGEVEPLDPQRWQAEQDAHRRGDRPRQERDRHHVEPGEGRHQLVAGIGPHGHEAPRAERDLPAIPREDVQPQRGDGVDEERHQHGVGPIVGDDERDGEHRHGQDRVVGPPVEPDREGLVVRGVGRLEVAGLTIEQRRYCQL